MTRIAVPPLVPWQERGCHRCGRPSYRPLGSRAYCRLCWESVAGYLAREVQAFDAADFLIRRYGVGLASSIAQKVLGLADAFVLDQAQEVDRADAA